MKTKSQNGYLLYCFSETKHRSFNTLARRKEEGVEKTASGRKKVK